MDDRPPVDLVRLEREERYFDREEVLGRDATSVFPTEARRAAMQSTDTIKAFLGGNRKFISETELEEIKGKRGESVEDGSVVADRPLAEILREAKDAKQAAFEDQWKQMKTGKNRPLDPEEADFLDSVALAESERLRRVEDEEASELAAFRAQQEAAAETAAFHAAQKAGPPIGPDLGPLAAAGADEEGEEDAGLGVAAPLLAPYQQQPRKQNPAGRKALPVVAVRRPVLRAVVRPQAPPAAAAAAGQVPAAKRQRVEGGSSAAAAAGEEEEEGEGEGLTGLLGAYGSSGSDSEEL